MCAITGFITSVNGAKFVSEMRALLYQSFERGRDGFGYVGQSAGSLDRWSDKLIPATRAENLKQQFASPAFQEKLTRALYGSQVFISNHRAEPTTEYIEHKHHRDQQPYSYDPNDFIVHNGVIANDKQLRTKFGLDDTIVQTKIDSAMIAPALAYSDNLFCAVREHLQGSMAIAAIRKGNQLELYRNYQPIYLYKNYAYPGARIFTSLANAGCHLRGWQLMDFPPYTYMSFSPTGLEEFETDHALNKHGLVVCSGGLDSTTAATLASDECDTLMLLHFRYNCKAQEREVMAVSRITNQLAARHPMKRIEKQFVDMSWLGNLGGSSLTEASRTVATGEAGAEFAHEWVPARNTSMIGIAAAFADRYNLHRMYLGLNLEESGAYADNTIEFYEHFNRALAVGTRSRVQIYNPLANMMKHEIVKLALQIGAPIDHAWSCYLGGQKSCGVCGPCFMRRKAFEMNGLVDPLEYEK